MHTRAWAGRTAGLDVVGREKIPVPTGNQTAVVHLMANHFTDSYRLVSHHNKFNLSTTVIRLNSLEEMVGLESGRPLN
jgi:hypothetical protein